MRAATASPERTGLWHAHAPPRATAQAPSATVSRSGDVRSVPAFLTAGTWAHMHGSRRGGAHPFSGLVDARSGSATRGRVRGTHLPSPLRVVDALAVLACPRRVCRVRVGRAVLHSNTTRWPRAGAQSWAREHSVTTSTQPLAAHAHWEPLAGSPARSTQPTARYRGTCLAWRGKSPHTGQRRLPASSSTWLRSRLGARCAVQTTRCAATCVACCDRHARARTHSALSCQPEFGGGQHPASLTTAGSAPRHAARTACATLCPAADCSSCPSLYPRLPPARWRLGLWHRFWSGLRPRHDAEQCVP